MSLFHIFQIIFALHCLMGSFCSKHGRRKLRKLVQSSMLMLKKVHITRGFSLDYWERVFSFRICLFYKFAGTSCLVVCGLTDMRDAEMRKAR